MIADPGCHMRYHVARQPERRAQHQTEEVVERVVIGLVQRLGAADPRVVDEEVDAAPTLHGKLHDARRRVVGGQVDGDGRHPVGVADRLFQFGKPVFVATRADDRHAHLRELGRTSEADATARTGHDRDRRLTHPPRSRHITHPLSSMPPGSDA